MTAGLHQKTRGKTFSWCHNFGGIDNYHSVSISILDYLLHHGCLQPFFSTILILITILDLQREGGGVESESCKGTCRKGISSAHVATFNHGPYSFSFGQFIIFLPMYVHLPVQECNVEEIPDEEEPPAKSSKDKKANGPDSGKASSLVFKITSKIPYKTVLKGTYIIVHSGVNFPSYV